MLSCLPLSPKPFSSSPCLILKKKKKVIFLLALWFLFTYFYLYERERERSVFHSLLHSPNAPNGRGVGGRDPNA